MKTLPLLNLVALAVLGVFIWMRDISWIVDASDTLPVLAAFPLFAWLTMPWKWQASPGKMRTGSMVAGLGLCLAGIAVDSTLLLAIGWIVFFDIFQTTFLAHLRIEIARGPMKEVKWNLKREAGC